MKKKLQVSSKGRGPGMPKWIPPEKRMRKYRKNMKDPKKVPFVDFRIVVPTEEDKKQLLAAFEFIHDNNSVMENDFIAINQLAHCYVTPELEKGHPEMIVVNSELFDDAVKEACPHTDTWVDNGIRICKMCQKHLEVTSYRDMYG